MTTRRTHHNRLTARLLSENAARGGRITAAKRLASPAVAIPRRPRRKAVLPVTRQIRACIGVPAIGRNPAYACTQRMLYRPNYGRPSTRCGRCRVLLSYRWRFSDANPEDIIAIIRDLAAKGLIGPTSKARAAWASETAATINRK